MPASAQNEHALLLACAAPAITEGNATARFEGADLDWQLISRLAAQHRIVPLLHQYVKRNGLNPPEHVLQGVEKHAREEALSNLFQTRELNRILAIFADQGIQAIPFKGPSLGFYLHDNLSVRPFGDLDLLVHREDFDAIKQIFADNDYRPYRDFSREDEKNFLDTQMGFEFVRSDERVVFEIHWSFLNKVHAFNLDPAEVWQHKVPFNLVGQDTFLFAPEHLLLYLCAHGSKSLWSRLRWISDIAELIVRDLDAGFWQRLDHVAKKSNSERMLLTGLQLAHQLLNAPLPEHVKVQIRADSTVAMLVEEVVDHLFLATNHNPLVQKPGSFHLRMRERFIDRVPYLLHMAQLWIKPSQKDLEMVRLPAPLHFLYLFVKPIRLLRRKEVTTAQNED